MAHAALSQKIEIQNEAEIREDLDKKPDEDEISDAEIIGRFKIAEAITNFVSDLKKLESIGKFDLKKDFEFTHKLYRAQFEGSNAFSQNSSIQNPWLKTAVEQFVAGAEPVNSYLISDFLPNCDRKNCRENIVTVESNSSDFLLIFTFTKSTPERARSAADAFGKIFAQKKLKTKNAANLPIYENTAVSSENNQVFVVTRLPRGSLDALLAAGRAR